MADIQLLRPAAPPPQTVTSDKTYGGKAKMVGNDLTLTLDGAAPENALYRGSTSGGIIRRERSMIIAEHVKPIDGQHEVEYTTQDASDACTDTTRPPSPWGTTWEPCNDR